MLFNSSVFLYAFLPVSILGYYLLAQRGGVLSAKIWLCAASFVFYGWWNPIFLLLLVGSIAFNYTVSVFLTGSDKGAGRKQTLLLVAGIAANLLLLFYFKYFASLLRFLHDLGWTRAEVSSIILPLGISFFTFTQIGYLVDCRQGLVRERGLVNYILFVTFFPHLIAGPILHHREVMPQFANPATYRFKAENLAVGLALFAFGLFKKSVLADSIAPWAEAGFLHPQGLPFIQSWSVALAYSMQLYFDFSGYSDMALALGIMFGVKLPLNFNSPYKATSIIDFWQRWHMTLTRYLTLLLYNPIALWVARRRQEQGLPGGQRAASTLSGFSSVIVLPMMVTMVLAGVWHGAGLQFFIFGALHGAYLCVNHAWRIFGPTSPTLQSPPLPAHRRLWVLFWPVALTYLAVLVSQIFFRAGSCSDALALLAGMFGANGGGSQPSFDPSNLDLAAYLLLALGLAVIAFCAPNVYQIMGERSPALTKVRWSLRPPQQWQPVFGWAAIGAVLLFLGSLRSDQAATFLYYQF
jgi:D-alanyl-lipoteichoic acid acyltransferase DltB (MBOAT superfamily)